MVRTFVEHTRSGRAPVLDRVRKALLKRRGVVTLRRLWPYLRPEAGALAVTCVLILLLTGLEVLTLVLVGAMVDTVLGEVRGARAAAPDWLLPVGVALMAAAALMRGALTALQGMLGGQIGERVAQRMRDGLWAHLQRLPLEYTRRRGAGRLLLRLTGDTRSVQRLVTHGIVRLVQDAALGAALLAVLAVVNLHMALAVFLVLPAYALIFRRLNPRLRSRSRAARKRRSRLSAFVEERVAAMALVKTSPRAAEEARLFAQLSGNLAARATRLAAVAGQVQGLAVATVALSGAVVLAVAAAEAEAGRITPGAIVTFYALLGLLVPICQRVVAINRYFQEAHISVERLHETLRERPEDHSEDRRPPLAVTGGYVIVESVTVHSSDGAAILDRVTLSARRGELVALVGPNGAGKSTLLELLPRLREPASGRVLIDDQPIDEVALASLRTQIGLVSQETPVFEGTIAENIAYGLRGDAPGAAVERAAQLAGLAELIAALPDGLATRVGRRGAALSAGQQQRIALARAIAADQPILLLDEATSALDGEHDRQIAQMIRSLAAEKTVIVAAHRPATLLVADRIYVLNRGRVVEEGTHAELLAADGLYARLLAGEPAGAAGLPQRA